MALAAPQQCMTQSAADLTAEAGQALDIGRHGVVVVVATDYTTEPARASAFFPSIPGRQVGPVRAVTCWRRQPPIVERGEPESNSLGVARAGAGHLLDYLR
jgi:hypothetical protein